MPSARKLAARGTPTPPVVPTVRNTVPPYSMGLAQQLIAAGRHDEAHAILESALMQRSLRSEANYLLAASWLMRDHSENGLRYARAAVALKPEDARYQFMLGRAFKLDGNLAGAEGAYRAALKAQPRYAEAMVSLGIVLKMQSQLDAAIAQYQRALELNPQMSAAHANLANALSLRTEQRIRQGFDAEVDDETLDSQGRAVALDPKNAVLHRNYGALLLSARRHHEAIAAFNEAISIDPSDFESCLRLGRTLADIGDSRLAREAYEKWLECNPPHAAVIRALASVLTRSGEVDAAIEWAEKAAALDRDPSSLINLGSTLMQLRRLADSLACIREGIDLGGRRADLYPALLLGLSYLHEDPQAIADVHAEFASRLAPAGTRPVTGSRPARLRIGYVSGDFVRHSVSYFLAGLFEHHDKSRFEVVCYHNSLLADAVTSSFQAFADQWVDCAGLSDGALHRRIVADGIDVLIDLSGHTAGSRVFVFTNRAAPVQIGYLGYPTISGVPAMDFRMTDHVIDPGDQPVLPHDRPLVLARSMFCYRPGAAPEPAPPPMVSRGSVTFGSFNNVAKLSDHTLSLWAAVLRAVPGSRLLLKATAMAQASNRAGIERFMAEHGIAAERLELFAWRADKNGHLGLYNEVDIALDCYPYNGATTTCEALWMGVPVVSRVGATHTSRMGASLLRAIGQTNWLANDDEAFVAIAARLASDPQALASWRAGARAHLQASELFDEVGFARQFEAAIDEAWTRRAADCASFPIGVTA